MVATLTFTPQESRELLTRLNEYPSLPTPSPYEQARHKVGSGIVTVYTSGKVVVQAPSADIEAALKEKIVSWLGETHDEWVFGIDEVGRGERHGPLVVAGVLGKRNALRGLRDSKKTGNIAKQFKEATGKSNVQLIVSLNAEMIDTLRNAGLNLNQIEADAAEMMHALIQKWAKKSYTIMDGKALRKGMNGIVFQEKADDSEPSVSAASIVAKHVRNESGDVHERKTWKKTKP